MIFKLGDGVKGICPISLVNQGLQRPICILAEGGHDLWIVSSAKFGSCASDMTLNVFLPVTLMAHDGNISMAAKHDNMASTLMLFMRWNDFILILLPFINHKNTKRIG